MLLLPELLPGIAGTTPPVVCVVLPVPTAGRELAGLLPVATALLLLCNRYRMTAAIIMIYKQPAEQVRKLLNYYSCITTSLFRYHTSNFPGSLIYYYMASTCLLP